MVAKNKSKSHKLVSPIPFVSRYAVIFKSGYLGNGPEINNLVKNRFYCSCAGFGWKSKTLTVRPQSAGDLGCGDPSGIQDSK